MLSSVDLTELYSESKDLAQWPKFEFTSGPFHDYFRLSVASMPPQNYW